MSDELDARRRRAVYRAMHRGTKEMDWLLGRWSQAHIADLDDGRLTQLESLLAEPDPLLHEWIMDADSVPDDRYADLVADVRAFHRLAPRT